MPASKEVPGKFKQADTLAADFDPARKPSCGDDNNGWRLGAELPKKVGETLVRALRTFKGRAESPVSGTVKPVELRPNIPVTPKRPRIVGP